MDLPSRGREYWTPTLGPIPTGAVAIKAEFPQSTTPGWVDFVTVDGAQVILVAGPDVDTDTWPNPPGTIVLPYEGVQFRRHSPNVLLVGPGANEIVIRKAGSINVTE